MHVLTKSELAVHGWPLFFLHVVPTHVLFTTQSAVSPLSHVPPVEAKLVHVLPMQVVMQSVLAVHVWPLFFLHVVPTHVLFTAQSAVSPLSHVPPVLETLAQALEMQVLT